MNVDKRHNSITDNKQTITRWLILAILAFNCSLAAIAQNIEINETNFPDANFRNWLLTDNTARGGDNGGMGGYGTDGVLTPTEINGITTLVINNKGIKNLKGIEFFTNINMLRLAQGTQSNQNQIATVDLSNNNKLQRFYAANIGLTNLILPTTKTVLRQVFCQNNTSLTGTLDLSGYTALEQFDSSGSNLEELIFDGCVSLLTKGATFNFNDNLKKIDISNCTQLQFSSLNWSGKNLETIIAKNCTRLSSLSYNKNTVKYIDLTGCTNLTSVNFSGPSKENYGVLETLILKGCANITSLNCQNNSLTLLDVTDCTKISTLNCNFNLLPKLELQTTPNIVQLQCADNLIQTIDLDPAVHTKLATIVANRAGRSVHHNLAYFPTLTNLQINGGPYLRKVNGVEQEMNDHSDPNRDHISMDVDYVEHLDLYGPSLRKLLCRHENLSIIDLSTNTGITEIELRNNRLLSLDLSGLSSLNAMGGIEPSNVINQFSVEDLVVFDRAEVGIYLPNARSASDADVSRFSYLDNTVIANPTLDTKSVTDGGDTKYYLIISKNATVDMDLYGNKFKYNYDTKCPKYPETMKNMDVTIQGNTYIMYINPNSGTPKESPTFYSGTIILQYDAIVPAGMKAYVLTDIKDIEKISTDKAATSVTSDQFVLGTAEYANAGDVIPANTPVYVTTTLPGLYAFKKNSDRDYHGWRYDATLPGATPNDKTALHFTETDIYPVLSAPSVNMLEGTVNDKSVGSHTLLTLGREKVTRNVVFWMFTGTNVPAHRAYIDFNSPSWTTYIRKGAILDLINNPDYVFKK